jgi:diguanylate cyclase (GGDEF)-like protein
LETVAYVEINAISLAILLLVYIGIHHRSVKCLFEQKLFLALLISNALLLILDTIQWCLDGKPGLFLKNLDLLMGAAYYILNPIPCAIWSMYANYQVYQDEKRLKKLMIALFIPVDILIVATLFNFFNGYLFYFDQNNVYHRGKLFILLVLVCYGYLAYTLIFIIIKQKQIKKKYLIPILVFAIPPFIGGIVQIIFYGVSLAWACMSLSVLMIFINVQDRQLYTDHLTGLYNRRELDYYLQERIISSNRDNLLAGIMVDLNSFKEINDIWGHSIGDKALVEAGKILVASSRKNDMICRYGGDEFAIIMDIKEKTDLIKIVDKIKMNTSLFAETRNAPYTISFSIGYDIYAIDSGMTPQQFLKHIDNLMYEDKQSRKKCAKQTEFLLQK